MNVENMDFEIVSSYFRNKKVETEEHLKQTGLNKCNGCNFWMDKDEVLSDGHCRECGGK